MKEKLFLKNRKMEYGKKKLQKLFDLCENKTFGLNVLL